jgi:hypothetical protein
MTTRYRLEPLTPSEMAQWDDLIAPYPGREPFHRKVWLDYLASTRKMETRLWAIREGRATAGYFCGGLLTKGPFRILGSPLKSWGTNFMGPVVRDDVEYGELLEALDVLARDERLAMTEIENTCLPEAALVAAHYEPVSGWTYVLPLAPEDPGRMWNALEPTCRNRIRKAMKAGLLVEDTDDPGIADQFYDQFLEVMGRQGLVPPYPREYVRTLVRYLRKADMLFALRVRDASSRVIATGLFLHDDRSLYFWGGASWHDARHLCPNDLVHWVAMSMAAERGVVRYDMSGYGQFKKKFGGRLVPLKRWHKSYYRVARWGRRAYEIYFQTSQRLRGASGRSATRALAAPWQGWWPRAVVGRAQPGEREA